MKATQTRLAALAAVIALASCTTTPERNAALEDIRTEYDRLAAQQEIRRHASDRLQDAQQAIRRAEKVWEESRDQELVEHYVYLAERRLDIAEKAAELGQAEQVVQNAEAERQQILSSLSEDDRNNPAPSQSNTFDRGAAERSVAEPAPRAEPLEEALAELEDQLTALEARRHQDGLVLTLEDMIFVSEEAELDNSYARTLDEIAELLNEYPQYRLHISGSPAGSRDPYEIGLAERRAQAIEQALVERGVDQDRFSHAADAEDPIASEPGAVRRSPTSSVEIHIEIPQRESLSGL